MVKKIKIKKIDYLPARQVTFSKRRRGLFKKAGELSVLCESDVAVVVISATGKLFDYSSSSIAQISTKDVIARYKSHRQLDQPTLEQQLETENHIRLSKDLTAKGHQLRQLNGEDLEDLNLDELQKLEKIVEAGLGRVLKTKEEKIMNEIMARKKKAAELIEANNQLRQRMVMLSNEGNTPGQLLEHNNPGVGDEEGMSSESATNITCNSGVSLEEDSSVDDLSLKLGLP